MKKIVSKSLFRKLSAAGKKAVIKIAKKMTSRRKKTTKRRRY